MYVIIESLQGDHMSRMLYISDFYIPDYILNGVNDTQRAHNLIYKDYTREFSNSVETMISRKVFLFSISNYNSRSSNFLLFTEYLSVPVHNVGIRNEQQ